MVMGDSEIQRRHEARSPFQLHHSVKDKSILEREALVKRGVRQLADLRGILLKRSGNSLNFTQWNEQINKALNQAALKKAIIGVVGNTGAGKTSLINAILGEGQLLPTNCMRACTATVTEIAYNSSLTRYVAEIEYIDPNEWKQELEMGWSVLFDSNQKIVKDATNEDTDAGIFYAKIKAVYTDLTRDELSVMTVDVLMKHSNMSVLGKVEKIEDNNAAAFSKRLQLMIDSKEYSDDADATRKSTRKRRANWPLIRKAKIYVKSSALSTGVTLVDLPGVQDSNPARAKIATDYLRQCSGLLVAAPIHRAVDDKVAKSLLGKSFKRQIMMDGGFNTVTFVCTKADDISITEASCSPQIEHHISQLTKEADEHQLAITALEVELERLEVLKDEADTNLSNAYDMQDKFEDVRISNDKLDPDAATASENVHQDATNKRKRHEMDSSPTGKTQSADDGQQNMGSETNSFDSSDIINLDRDIAHWSYERKKAQEHKRQITERIQINSNRLHDRKSGLAAIESEKFSVCINQRNLYVEQALKRDFVAGVKEFDQERIANENVAGLDLEIERRNYTKMHEELQVFCVSAKAFQKKLGHLDQEPDLAGFPTMEDTGIPQLQEHCKQLTNAGRVKSADYFLAMMSALLNSLSLWVTNELNGSVLTDQQRIVLKQVLEHELSSLRAKLVKIVSDICAELKYRIRNHLYRGFEPARVNALKEANDTAKAWGQLAHQTWRAVCVRQGTFENCNGKYDWNEELVNPILEHLAPSWEATFNDLLINTFRKFGLSCRKAVKQFHRSIPDLLLAAGSKTPERHRLLQGQLENYKHAFEAIEDYGKDTISSEQRLISRAFKPAIQQAMTGAYKKCLAETGSGSWKRMKEHMVHHVSDNPEMFRDSTKAVQAQLDNLLKKLRESMKQKVEEVHDTIYSDYMSTLVGGGTAEVIEGGQSSGLLQDLLKFIDESEDDFNKTSAHFHNAIIKVEELANSRETSHSFLSSESKHASRVFEIDEDVDTDEPSYVIGRRDTIFLDDDDDY